MNRRPVVFEFENKQGNALGKQFQVSSFFKTESNSDIVLIPNNQIYSKKAPSRCIVSKIQPN